MERIGALLPIGSGDPNLHFGARRRSRRFPLNAEVTVRQPQLALGVAINASAGGLRVAIDVELPQDQTLDIELRFTDERASVERARVVWSKRFRDGFIVGLEFVDVDWDIPTDPEISRAA